MNGIIREDQVIDATSLPKIVMPNRNGFILDPRPKTPVERRTDRRESAFGARARAVRSFHEHVPVITSVLHNRRHIVSQDVAVLHERRGGVLHLLEVLLTRRIPLFD
jgi:hypothetical protein